MLINRGSGQPLVHASPTTIADENRLKPGSIDWDITGAGDPDIQGFATDISVNVGDTVHFKIAAPGATAGYKIDIYRLGYYGGAGATLVTTRGPSAAMPQTQPPCLNQMATTGLVDCGNWADSATWTVPATAVSGIYLAKLARYDNGHNSHIVFVVRDDSRTADIVFQTSDTTWQAYNQYPGVSAGGASLYCGGPLSNDGSSYSRSCATRAAKVSYNRPFDTRAHDPQSWLFNAEYPMVRWLEANGYDVKYQSGVDTDRRGFDLTGTHKPKVFLSVGHDEYWSGNQRKTVENARNAGVSLAFFSGNEMYWKTRYEPSIDASGAAYRTLVTYKETIANAKIDPAVDPITHVPIWTGTWRDPRFAATTDGGRPENGLIGQIFTINCCSDRIKIPQEMGTMRLWAHTGVSAVAPGDFYRTPEETLGYEWDEDLDNGSRPAGLIRLSSTTLDEPEKLIDFGANIAQGRATHSLTMYRHNSGAIVFGAGTVQWSWGLDANHDRGTTPTSHTTDQAMEQATVNLFADMGVQPATLQAGADPTNPRLVAATKSTDIASPTTTIVSPAPSATVSSGVRITITGTASDASGIVSGVEVSVDGGTTWKAAKGTTLWSYDWTPGIPGSATIRARAIDDSGNLEAAGPGTTVSIAQGECPCTTLWRPTAVPTVPSAADGNAVELGVLIKSDIDGFITGIRFYKGSTNTGTHVGSLWTEGGVRLANAEFTGETNSGWQQVSFSTPVAITANTVYVASYHTNVGSYSADGGYFATTGVDSPPLHALQSTASRPNGRFSYGASQFPVNSFNATNYWVDVVFAPSLSDTTPPEISAVKATTLDSSRVTLTWTTDEPANSRIDYGTDPGILTSAITNLPPGTTTITDANFGTQHTTPLVGLRPNTTYYYLITATDHSGNSTTLPAPTFTVPGPTLRDTSVSDFQAGTSAGGTYVSQTTDGELILAPTAATEFTGPALSQGWIEVPWSPEGYSIIVDGVLLVDGARVASCAIDANGNCLPETTDLTQSATFTAPHTLEFTANFSGDRFQHAGLGVTFASTSEPWAIFSTLNGGLLFARTNTGSTFIDTGLGTGLLGAFHHYKIDWKADSVDYYVDGALVASHALAVGGHMRPVAASDFNPFGGTIFVDWMRMSPYAPSGTFFSRIFDAESAVDWNSIQWRATTPAGTSVAVALRGGNTAVPDATWSNFVPMSSGGPITMNSQFIQYRATLTSSNTDITPQLEDVIISTGHAPVANADSAIVPENGSHLFPYSGPGSLVANDTDPDPGDVLRVVSVTAPSHGTAIVNPDGSVLYTPLATYSGPDAFTYTVSDGLLTASAPVTIDVRFGNIPPIALNDFYNIDEDATLTVPAAIGVLVNDTDTEHDPLSAVLTSLPLHGTLTFGANGGFSYTPVANYAGPDSFRYKANDGAAESNEATVTIAVNQVNDPPLTVDDAFTAVLNQPLDVPAAFNAGLGRFVSGVLANDHDVEVEDTAPLHAQLVAGPSHGQLILAPDGGFSYVPDADFLGADSFTYRALDHFNAAGNVGTVTITVALKAVASAVNAGATVATGSGSVDPSDPLHSAVTSPIAGTVSIAQGVISGAQAPTGYTFLNQQVNITVLNPDGSEVAASFGAPITMVFNIDRSLIPAGQDETTLEMFRNGVRIPDCLGNTTITAANLDPCISERLSGAAVSNDVRVTLLTSHASRWNMGLSTAEVGDAPIANNDGPYLVDFQTPLVLSAPGVLGNDIGRSSLTAFLVGTPVNGAVHLTPSGAFTFNPDPAACGAAGFTYRATDGVAESADATVAVTIDCKPRPGDDAATVLEDSGLSTITVLANDTDPDPGQALSVTAVTQPSNGAAAVMSGMAVTYRPNLNFYGSDSFTYTVSDGRGGTATATVNVTVKPVNDAPKFTAGADVTVLEDSAVKTVAGWATGISAGPSNESGQALNFLVSSSNTALFSTQPAIAADGTLTFAPAPDANGSATITVRIQDAGGTADGGVDTSAAQTFAINVTAINDAPSFAKGADQLSAGIVGARTVPNWATNISAGPADEAGQLLNFIVTSDNPAMFAAQPAVAANGTLTYTPMANVEGASTVSVALHDNGGTANGGVDTSAPQTFTISVHKAATTTTVATSVNSVYGDPLTFTATVAVVAPGVGTPSGTVTFIDGAATLGTGSLDATGKATFTTAALSAGSHSIVAVYGGAALFTGSTSAALSQTVGQRTASVTPNVASKTYGSTDPVFSGALAGFLAADNVTATYSRTAGETVAGGPYVISATLAPASALANYSITYNTAAFTIGKASASVTPASASKIYGTADPALGGTLAGFVAADGVVAAYSRAAGESVAGGPYTISATLSPAAALANYAVTYNTAAFSITKATASVTPNAASKTYGAVDPSLTGTLTGFVAADGVSAAYSRTAGETVAGGPYAISATLAPAAALANYTVTYNSAAFTINKAPASVTPNAATKIYGAADPALTGILAGFRAADAVTAAYSRTTGENVAGSPYTISATLSPAAVLGNYTITSNTAAFTITTAPLKITADNKSRVVGAANPALTVTYAGLVNGDSAASLTTPPTVTTTATATSPVGTYPITASGAVSGNYTITYVNGTLTVSPAQSTTVVTASSNPGLLRLPITFTATVTPVAPATGIPTGTVTFKDGATTIGTAALSNGIATLSTATLALGTHTITAAYGGSGSFTSSTSAALSEVINPSGTLTVNFTGHAIMDDTKKPKVVDTPIDNAEIRVFVKGDACAYGYIVTGASKIWGPVYENCTPIKVDSYLAKGTTDANGNVSIIVPPTTTSPNSDFVVIGKAMASMTDGTTQAVYSEHTVSTVNANDSKRVLLHQIRTFNGKVVPGKDIEEFGTYLGVVQPEFLDWTENEEQYPLILVAEGNWSLTTGVTPPAGFVPDVASLSTDVVDTTSAIQFTMTDVGSDWTETVVNHSITHQGGLRQRNDSIPMTDKKVTTAKNDTFKVMHDSPATVLNVMLNDKVNHLRKPITITSITPALNGTVVVADDRLSVSYTPNAGYSGVDTFTYTITDLVGGTSTGTVTVNVLATPAVSVKNTSVVEGNSGSSLATINVVLSNQSLDTVTVNYTTVDGSATAGADYTAASGTVTFVPGDISEPITIPILGDTLAEANEHFTVVLSNPSNATIAANPGGDITITDDDPPEVTIAPTATITEGNTGTNNVAIAVTLSQTHGESVWVTYTTSDGTATAGSDYIASTGTLQFYPGTKTQNIYIPVYGDTIGEASETFYVDISNPLNGTLTAATRATVTIVDDDNSSKVFATTADFNAGTVGTGMYVSETVDGEITLAPTQATEFSGASLPAAWATSVLATGGAASVAGGKLTIDGAALIAPATAPAGQTLEFVATFSGSNQNIGFGTNGTLVSPMAMFIIRNNGLYARSVNGAKTVENLLSGVDWLRKSHRFQITTTAGAANYYIDGTLMISHTSMAWGTAQMAPVISDSTAGDAAALTVDWIRVTPFAGSGTYTSSVFDAGAAVTWLKLTSTNTIVPYFSCCAVSGTTTVITYRTGNSPVPDASWTPFTALGTAGALTGSSRYIQYMVQMTTTNPGKAPAVQDVTVQFKR